jgi:hypothetical protein
VIDAGVTLYEFAEDGTGLKLLDLNDVDDRALGDIKAVFAALEKAKPRRRVKRAVRARAKSRRVTAALRAATSQRTGGS